MYMINKAYTIPVYYVEMHDRVTGRDYRLELSLIGLRTIHHNPDRETYDPAYYIELRTIVREFVGNEFFCEVHYSSATSRRVYRADKIRKVLRMFCANYLGICFENCSVHTHQLIDRAYTQELLDKLQRYNGNDRVSEATN